MKVNLKKLRRGRCVLCGKVDDGLTFEVDHWCLLCLGQLVKAASEFIHLLSFKPRSGRIWP